MDHRAGWCALALVLGLAPAGSGQGGGMRRDGGFAQNLHGAGAESPKAVKAAVRVLAADGKAVDGTLRLTTAVVASTLGVYEIKPEKVREIRLDPRAGDDFSSVLMDAGGVQRPGRVVTTGGEVIEGMVFLPQWWRVETDLGELTPNPVTLQSITFVREADAAPEDQLQSIPTPPLRPGSARPIAPADIDSNPSPPPAGRISPSRTRRVAPPTPIDPSTSPPTSS